MRQEQTKITTQQKIYAKVDKNQMSCSSLKTGSDIGESRMNVWEPNVVVDNVVWDILFLRNGFFFNENWFEMKTISFYNKKFIWSNIHVLYSNNQKIKYTND